MNSTNSFKLFASEYLLCKEIQTELVVVSLISTNTVNSYVSNLCNVLSGVAVRSSV